jgi:hypothetical protein
LYRYSALLTEEELAGFSTDAQHTEAAVLEDELAVGALYKLNAVDPKTFVVKQPLSALRFRHGGWKLTPTLVS